MTLADQALPYAERHEWLPQPLMHHAEFTVERPYLVVRFTDGSALKTIEGDDSPWIVENPKPTE